MINIDHLEHKVSEEVFKEIKRLTMDQYAAYKMILDDINIEKMRLDGQERTRRMEYKIAHGKQSQKNATEKKLLAAFAVFVKEYSK